MSPLCEGVYLPSELSDGEGESTESRWGIEVVLDARQRPPKGQPGPPGGGSSGPGATGAAAGCAGGTVVIAL